MFQKIKLHIIEIISLIIFISAYSILLMPFLFFESINMYNIIGATLIFIAITIMYGSIKTWWKYRGNYIDKSAPLYNNIEKIASKMNAKQPRLIILDTPTPNAYATDALPTKPIVILTTGLLQTLNEKEIEAVIAHEISHINSYDIFYMMFLSTLMSFVRRKHNFTRQFMYSGDILAIIIFIIPFIITRINLFICRLNFFLISRVREYGADKDAANATSPKHMKNALIKINKQIYNLDKLNQNKFYGEEPLCIIPFANTKKLFRTHPKLEKRLKALSK